MAARGDARSLIDHGIPGQHAPVRRRPSPLLALLRLVTGLAAIAIGAMNALGHAAVARHAADWGLPAPATLTWVGVALLLVFGLGLLLGLASRLCALILLGVVLVIVATAGRVDGGLPLIGGAALAVALLVLIARGGGAGALLDRVDPAA